MREGEGNGGAEEKDRWCDKQNGHESPARRIKIL